MISVQQLYQLTKHKTRVVILATKAQNNITTMLLHVMKYHNKHVDFFLTSGENHITESNEFIVIEAAKYSESYKANIALVSDVNSDIQTANFINSITNGGMLVYTEEVAAVKLLVEANSNTIKKYPYQAPNYILENDIYYLDTNEGKLPLEITNQNDIKHILGVKWICQHMGVDEDDFFEAVGTFASL